MRAAAARALGEIKDPRAVEPLIAALEKYDHKDVGAAAAEALGKIGDARAVEPLIAALDTALGHDQRLAIPEGPAFERICISAAKALGQIGDPRAVKPLVAAIYRAKIIIDSKRWSYYEYVRKVAAEALVKIGVPAVEPLIVELKDWQWRQDAAHVLVQINDPRAVEPLIAALRNENEYVCRTAAEALKRLGWKPDTDENAVLYWLGNIEWEKCVAMGAPAVEPLIAALKVFPRGAAYALGQIGDPRAVEPLIAVLKKYDHKDVREAAAEALVKIGTPAVDLLSAALKDEEWSVRRAAAKALGQIGDPRAVESLIAALKDEERRVVREAAAEALDRLGWKPRQDETAGWYWIAKREWEQCIALGAPAVEPLIAALKNSDVPKAAAYALGKIGDARAVEPLIAALKNEDSDVHRVAADALGEIGDARAVQPLITTLQSTNDPYTRRDVAQALVRLYQKSSISQEDRERILAVRDHLIRIHDDKPHIDEFKDCSSNRPHTDIELGVEFPL